MIARLKGILDETGLDWAVIDVAGVGYLVHCSSKTLAALGEVGEGCSLFTDLQVSENDMRLLGFATARRTRLVPPVDPGAGRGQQSRAGDPFGVVDRRPPARLRRTRRRHRRPRARGGAEAGEPDRQRVAGQGGRAACDRRGCCNAAWCGRARMPSARCRTLGSSRRLPRKPLRVRSTSLVRGRARAT